jgi:hypothetical protein
MIDDTMYYWSLSIERCFRDTWDIHQIIEIELHNTFHEYQTHFLKCTSSIEHTIGYYYWVFIGTVNQTAFRVHCRELCT